MFIIPSSGISRSVSKHNVNVNIMCDWIEANVLFYQDLSKMDIIDVLLEEQIYVRQDFATEIVEICWAEFHRRKLWMKSGYPFELLPRRIHRVAPDWYTNVGYAFCLLLSLSENYDWWTEEFGRNYNEQGEFFEVFVKHSIEMSFPSWDFFRTGWTRTNTMGLNSVVHEVAQRVGADVGDLPLWDGDNSKELGLDLLGYRNFDDGRQGNIVYLIQCASGADWKHKLKTPDLEVWRSLVTFAQHPNRGFATPFLFDDDTFKRNCIRVNGLLLDRARLFSSTNINLPTNLNEKLVRWCEQR